AGDRDLERLDDPAVLHARRAGRLAGPAIEAEVEVVADVRAQPEPAVGHGAHQVDPTAGAVVLVAGLDVGRAARGAEAAVDAVRIERVVEPERELFQVDGGGLGAGGGFGAVRRRDGYAGGSVSSRVGVGGQPFRLYRRTAPGSSPRGGRGPA